MNDNVIWEPSELVATIVDLVPDLIYAEPTALFRLKLLANEPYEHVGYYEHVAGCNLCTNVSNLTGELPQMHLDNLTDTIMRNSPWDSTGYYFVTKADQEHMYHYSFYKVGQSINAF